MAGRFSSLHCDETSLRNSRPFQTPSKKPHVGCLSRTRRINFVASRGAGGDSQFEKRERDHRRDYYSRKKRGTRPSSLFHRNGIIFILSATVCTARRERRGYIFDTIFENYSSVANKSISSSMTLLLSFSPPFLRVCTVQVYTCTLAVITIAKHRADFSARQYRGIKRRKNRERFLFFLFFFF